MLVSGNFSTQEGSTGKKPAGTTRDHLSNEKNLGWLGYIGDYTTQLYGDYNTPL